MNIIEIKVDQFEDYNLTIFFEKIKVFDAMHNKFSIHLFRHSSRNLLIELDYRN